MADRKLKYWGWGYEDDGLSTDQTDALPGMKLLPRLDLAEHFGALAIASLDPAVAEMRKHLVESHRDRSGQESLELLLWLTPPGHIGWAA